MTLQIEFEDICLKKWSGAYTFSTWPSSFRFLIWTKELKHSQLSQECSTTKVMLYAQERAWVPRTDASRLWGIISLGKSSGERLLVSQNRGPCVLMALRPNFRLTDAMVTWRFHLEFNKNFSAMCLTLNLVFSSNCFSKCVYYASWWLATLLF